MHNSVSMVLMAHVIIRNSISQITQGNRAPPTTTTLVILRKKDLQDDKNFSLYSGLKLQALH